MNALTRAPVDPIGLGDAAVAVLAIADAVAKAEAAIAFDADWRAGRLAFPALPSAPVPDRPARPERPPLVPAREMKRRSVVSLQGRVALLHALAHIELNAIDLAADLVARFGCDGAMPRAFTDDWVRIAAEEGRHFLMLQARLRTFGASYGDLPAHDGLWQAALATRHDLAARLAVVPMVLEARGLDVTSPMIGGLEKAGDPDSAAAVALIQQEEVGHVASGLAWFRHLCAGSGEDPQTRWQALVRTHFRGLVKPPFNDVLRQRAGFSGEDYRALAEG